MGGYFSKTFDPIHDIPNLSGRVAVVTGSNAGIGFITAQQLANHGAKVYIGARSESKALAAIEKMQSENPELRGPDRLIWLDLDLSSVKKAKEAAERILTLESRVDIIVNNAGQMASPFGLTEEGLSTSFASNHVGHFVFTTTLLPVLNATAKLAGADVRVINVSSTQHTKSPANMKFESLEDFRSPCAPPSSIDSYSASFARYGQGKLANILFTKELQRRWDAEGVPAISIALHPGGVATDTVIKMLGRWSFILPLVAVTPFRGAITSLFAATAPEVKAQTSTYKGTYLTPYGKVTKPSAKAEDTELAKQLWLTSESVTADILAKGRQ